MIILAQVELARHYLPKDAISKAYTWKWRTGLDNQTLYRWRERILYAPFSVSQPCVTSPLNPAHGLWRCYSGQVEEVDVRTSEEARLYLPLVKRD